MDAVAPGFAADIDDAVAHAGGGGVENLVGVRHAHGHRVDQNIAVIGLVEIGFAADGGHADAIAIAAYPGDHALHQMLHLGVIGAAKTQRVEVGDGPRAHGEHIAQNAADAGRRALVWLDIAGVVVRFHLEDGGLTIADVDHAGVFAGAADHPGRLGGQLLQVEAAGFVRAMFRPHHRKYAQFQQVGLAAHGVKDALVFLWVEAVRGDDLWGDGGVCGCGAHGSAP